MLNPAPEDEAATWAEAGPEARGCEERLGGEGTPAVAAWAAEELAAALQITPPAAMQLMADALNLRHRHPLIWARVEALAVAPWRARRVAQATATRPAAVATEVDRLLAPVVDSCGVRRIEAAVAAAAARLEPEEQAAAEQHGHAGWGVALRHPDPGFYAGTSYLEAAGDTADLTAFHDLVCAVAGQLRDPDTAGADTDPDLDLAVRKARALGVIADRALAGMPVLDTARPIRPATRTRLYLHLDAADLPDPSDSPDAGVTGWVERLGPATVERLRAWLAGTHATVLPVLHLDRADAVDGHEPPAWMRELVVLRDRCCVFPGCQRSARACDLDHIDPYDETGPPGQTRPANLAPLCWRHHRAKTLGRWRYSRNPDGSYTWHSPTGRALQVETGRVLGDAGPMGA